MFNFSEYFLLTNKINLKLHVMRRMQDVSLRCKGCIYISCTYTPKLN